MYLKRIKRNSKGNYTKASLMLLGFILLFVLLVGADPPNVSLDNPDDNYVYDTTQFINITFNATVSDNQSITNCSLWHNISGWNLNQTQNITGTSNTTSFSLNLTNTTFLWNIQCYDNNSNASFASNRTVILNWTGADAAPNVTLNSPSNLDILTYVNVTFNCSATDNGGLVNVTLYGNFSGTWLANETQNLTGTSNSTTFQLNLTDNTTYTWNCYVFDTNQGVFASSNFSFSVNTSYAPTCQGSNVTYYLEPYVMAWNETTEIIGLETNQATNITIQYGETQSYGSSVNNASFATKHELIINNLTPNTMYYYKVIVKNLSGGNCYQNSSFNNSFRISDDSKTSFTFAVIGDSRGGSCGYLGANFDNLIKNISTRGVDFVVMTGDDIQAEGCSSDDDYWQGFHNVTGIIRKNSSFLSAIGNHEDPDRAAARASWVNYWIHPLNGDGASGYWNETTFYWRYGNSLFIFLNTEEPADRGDIAGNQFTWFNETALNQSGYTHKFVFSHKPLAASTRSGTLPGDDAIRSQMIGDLMYSNGVTAAFYGHNHLYCYNTTHDGEMLHIITGGGGSSLHSGSSYCLGLEKSQFHYVLVNVSGNTITGEAINLSGTIIHNFSRQMVYCGDSICNNGEDCSSCSSDCGGCGSSSSGGGSSRIYAQQSPTPSPIAISQIPIPIQTVDEIEDNQIEYTSTPTYYEKPFKKETFIETSETKKSSNLIYSILILILLTGVTGLVILKKHKAKPAIDLLKQYIGYYIKKGTSQAAIIAACINRGWNKEEVISTYYETYMYIYIRQQLKNGIPQDKLVEGLVKNGWDRRHILKIIEQLKHE